MQLTSGLLNSMVTQRSRRNVSDAPFAGTCAHDGRVVARVTKGPRAVKGFEALEVGRAAAGRFSGALRGLPAGGPYHVDLSLLDASDKAVERASVRNVLVGDVWIAAGQSNMQGCGVATEWLPKVDEVRAFMMDDAWRVARDPIHNMWACIDQVHVDISGRQQKPANRKWGVGPAVAFAQEMRRLTKVPQGVLACGHGGTSMAQWDPEKKSLGSKSLYGATCRRLAKNGGKVAGVIWYQGESDADRVASAVYTEKMKALIAAFRRDAGDPELPFALVQISRVVTGGWDTFGWESIREQERRLPSLVPNVATVPAIDLEMEDLIHVSGPEHTRLGKRLAGAMAAMKKVKGAGKPPIEFAGFSLELDQRTGNVDILVNFRNVEGKLIAGGRPSGFALTDPRPVSGVFRAILRGASVRVKISGQMPFVEGKYLNYGAGLDPYCNITDEADRSLPAFHRILIGEGRALTPFVKSWRRSDMLAPSGEIASPLPPTVKLRHLDMPGDFLDLHPEIEKVREDRVIYFTCRVECPEAMKLAACLGYDGPVKMWIDSREACSDPAGTNPCLVDRLKVPFDASAGAHDIVVALNTHGGRAWGIYLRFERLDVAAALLKTAPERVVLPEVTAGD